ncbi:fumarate reductase subunit A [Methanomicrobium antiquum]|uniref:Fumarate reductase subunit A n=1 Tax=Methanomicrobium antiquum TaxID=487686 RepID=A0AAF0FQU2_9EURY|nr:fumarate reductase (CoM/CoB) subunit TfrA [Methanomicrobium antiquum]MDD3976750.1 fumarate reductase subunit A [Methanomicrobium sp.]WFN36887.1 fumarate reductase subunit A [Methanomicrobium antiquum]
MLADNMTDCHVLVIGSGGAGVRAAIEASRYGETIIVSKSLAGKGGCTTMAEGGYNAVINCEDSCPLHEEDTLKGGGFLNIPKLVEILVKEAPERIADLVSWGAVFDVTPERMLAQRPFGGQKFPRTCFAGDRTGHEMMMTLIERVRQGGIQIMQEITIIDLLKTEDDGGRVCGAVGLNRRGEMVIIRSDAVVLATGGLGQIYDVCTNCATGNGQGYSIGYRAGAELIDMEMVQFHPTGLVYPYDARGRLITEAVRGEGGILKNIIGERFMKNYDPKRMELSTRDIVSRAIATEILEGRGTEKGGVYLDVSHLPADVIEERLPLMLEQFLTIGVDIRKEPMEVAPTAHHMMGGIRINTDCQTSVPGLFACGEVTGGIHGANRLGGNSLADTQVFGKRAGEFAGKSPVLEKSINPTQIEKENKRLKGFLSGTESIAVIKKALKKTMWENAGIFRTESELKKALLDIENLKGKMPKAVSKENLADACVLEDMLTSAELVVKGALLREESRGAHVRKDIKTEWTPDKSPFGHTYQSLSRSGIEKKEVF